MNCRSRSQAALPGDAQPLTEPAQKITFAEMRDMGVRGVVACSPLTMGVRPDSCRAPRFAQFHRRRKRSSQPRHLPGFAYLGFTGDEASDSYGRE